MSVIAGWEVDEVFREIVGNFKNEWGARDFA